MTIPPPRVRSIFHACRGRSCPYPVLWEKLGRGGGATAKPTVSRRSSADGFAVKMKRTKAGGRVVKSCSPFSAAKWQRQKSRRSRGRVEIFCEAKNTTRPLTVWIVETEIGRDCFRWGDVLYLNLFGGIH